MRAATGEPLTQRKLESIPELSNMQMT